jgi:hypothetical protein
MTPSASEPTSQDAAQWQQVPREAFKLAQELMGFSQSVRQAIAGHPLECLDAILYSPQTKEAAILLSPGCPEGVGFDLAAAISPLVIYPWICKAGEAPAWTAETWVPVARGTQLPDREKLAETYSQLDDQLALMLLTGLTGSPTKAASDDYSPALRGLGELSGYLPGGHYSWQIPGVPRYLQGMLGGGLIGAGLGYGAGWLGSRVLPSTWDRTKLPKTLAILGSLAGAAPGAASLASSAANGDISRADDLFGDGPPDVKKFQQYLPTYPSGQNAPAQFVPNPAYDPAAKLPASPSTYKIVHAALVEERGERVHPIVKKAISQTGYELDDMPLPIPIDYVAESVWDDPRVAYHLPVPMRAATTGLLESAYNAKIQREGDRRGPRIVTPGDIASITAGAGAGYLSGALIGKVLGGLVGMPESTQDQLKQVGLWSGVIQQIIPLAFPQWQSNPT